ncbi:Peptide transport system ATP-binding protein SapF [Candidatus Providencia siddallii]|uniref:Peptide transport system ATP-binding protein SapF n=1 Tax=Candidatus Providencia siddallii TaxID=1715285 RepID=A0A0M6W6J5_9GAMM|nr:Peptide transport system ATP-binding protein SapF [Candidatus Providencia siddallii]
MMKILLEVRNLTKIFYFRKCIFYNQKVDAVKSVNFDLQAGQTLSIIGENGSGKSTLVRMLSGILKPTDGEIFITGYPLKFRDYNYRNKRIRMIFKDPNKSLNPSQRIWQILDFPLKLNTDLNKINRKKHIFQILKQVGLLNIHAEYYPHMLSFGQKQRVVIARALILQPDIIIADELFASLDMFTRSQIINLMLELQKRQNVSYIYVTHHLGIVKHVSDKVLVMSKGEIVEQGDTNKVLSSPLHNVTRRLIEKYFS